MLDKLLHQVAQVFRPFQVFSDGELKWWSIYEIGQRTCNTFAITDKPYHSRVRLVGNGSSPFFSSLGCSSCSNSLSQAYQTLSPAVHI